MADTPPLEVAGCQIEFVNGDGSYVVTVAYRTDKGQSWPIADRFTFATAAKLKKFINGSLLGGTTVTEAEEDKPAAS